MPADESLQQTPSAHHGDASKPYPCSQADAPPGSAWGIDYGYCRTSLDNRPLADKVGSSDPRCPADCKHKATKAVAMQFQRLFLMHGAQTAAAFVRRKKEAKT